MKKEKATIKLVLRTNKVFSNSIRITAKLTGRGMSTIQRIKREFEKEISQ